MSERIHVAAIAPCHSHEIERAVTVLLKNLDHQYDPPQYQVEPTEIEDYLTEHPSDTTFYGLWDTENDAILAAAAVEHAFGSKVAYIAKVAVERVRQRKGYGRLLMGHIAEAVVRAGGVRLELTPISSAQGFYTRLGFEPVAGNQVLLTALASTVAAEATPSE